MFQPRDEEGHAVAASGSWLPSRPPTGECEELASCRWYKRPWPQPAELLVNKSLAAFSAEIVGKSAAGTSNGQVSAVSASIAITEGSFESDSQMITYYFENVLSSELQVSSICQWMNL